MVDPVKADLESSRAELRDYAPVDAVSTANYVERRAQPTVLLDVCDADCVY